MQSQFYREKQGDLFEQKMCETKNALHTRHIAFKSKIPWYLAKQMTKVFKRNSNQFHQCHERSKDIEISLISF